MTNTVNIPETTLAVLADHLQHDTFGLTERKVVRVTDHADNDTLEVGDDHSKMAIFECKRRGMPWTKWDNVLASKVHVGLLPPTDVTVLFPDWDYSEF